MMYWQVLFKNFTSCKVQGFKIRAWLLNPAPRSKEMCFFPMQKCLSLLFDAFLDDFFHVVVISMNVSGQLEVFEKLKKWAWPTNCPLIMQFQENGQFWEG